MTNTPFKALTIAGSDTSGGAGLEADIKTFQEHGVYGMVALTCVVAQNPAADWRHDVFPIELDTVEAQLVTVLDGIGVHAAKTGMLATKELVSLVVKYVKKYNVPNLVVDPVMVCKGADAPLNPDVANALRDELAPLATVITPNLYEAGILSGLGLLDSVEAMEAAALKLAKGGARFVLVKGGSKLKGAAKAIDVFASGDGKVARLESELIPNAYTHGAGCTISAAIAANLAKGLPVVEAIQEAKKFETAAIRASFPLNKWVGPLRHDAWRL
jgi:phosphomethylpyrimidine kinase